MSETLKRITPQEADRIEAVLRERLAQVHDIDATDSRKLVHRVDERAKPATGLTLCPVYVA